MHAASPVSDGPDENLSAAASSSTAPSSTAPSSAASSPTAPSPRLCGRRWLLVPALLALVVIARVVATPAPAELELQGAHRHGVDDAARAAIFWQIARWQVIWRAKAKAHFPSHLWSAEDDYHWNVRSHVDKVLAGQFRVPASTIWAVYDEGIRGQWQVPPPPGASALERLIWVAGPLTATVVPLRPRQK